MTPIFTRVQPVLGYGSAVLYDCGAHGCVAGMLHPSNHMAHKVASLHNRSPSPGGFDGRAFAVVRVIPKPGCVGKRVSP